jgi:plasmid stability protein
MTELKIRNLDPQVIAGLKAQAKRKGVSVEQELRHIVTHAVAPDRSGLAEQLRKLRDMTPDYIRGTDSTPVLRRLRSR